MRRKDALLVTIPSIYPEEEVQKRRGDIRI